MAILVSDLGLVGNLVKYGVIPKQYAIEEEGQFGTRYNVSAKASEEAITVDGSDAPSVVYTTEDKLAQFLELEGFDLEKFSAFLDAHSVDKFTGQDTGALIVKFARRSESAKSALELLNARIPAKSSKSAKSAPKAAAAGDDPFAE